jgi:mersacidin/lichenicidin family type 2 lantibiotic
MQTPEVLQGVDLARALKDEAYRSSLTTEQQQALTALSEQSELSEEDLDQVAGGSGSGTISPTTYNCKPTFTL